MTTGLGRRKAKDTRFRFEVIVAIEKRKVEKEKTKLPNLVEKMCFRQNSFGLNQLILILTNLKLTEVELELESR